MLVAAAKRAPVLSSNNVKIVFFGEGEIKSSLGLHDLALADFTRGLADFAADVDIC